MKAIICTFIIFSFFFLIAVFIAWSIKMTSGEKNTKKGKEIIREFILMCDGIPHYVEPHENIPSTWEMGLCGLSYEEETNTLTISVRRPGVVIGKAGRTYDKIREELGVNINLKEVTFK